MDTPNYKIAFLFLVIDDINFPTIWENYFRGNEDKFSIYCHPKHPENVVTPWLRDNIIPHLVETSWGHITDAYFTLLYEALKDPLNTKFIIISESCLPLRSFDDLYHKLITDDIKTSYIRFWEVTPYDIRERLQNQDRYPYMIEKFGRFTKHYARFCLSRYHVLKLFGLRKEPDFIEQPLYEHDKAINFFNRMHVGDEFFLTLLKPIPGRDYIQDYEITYDDWDWVLQRKIYLTNKIAELKSEEDDTILENEVSKIKQRIKDKEEQKEKVREFKKQYKKDKANKLAEYEAELELNSGANPRTYNTVSRQDILQALRKKSFFWRKFPVTSNVFEYYSEDGTPIVLDERKETPGLAGGKKQKTRRHKTRTKKSNSKTIKKRNKRHKNKRH